MAYTFNEQLNKLSRLLGDSNTSTDDQFPLADRKEEINRGEVLFARRSKSILRYATGTIASQVISLPTDFFEIHELVVNDENFTGIREMPLQDWERLVNASDGKYYFWANASGTREIKFVDSTRDGQTYKLWYFAKPTTALSATTDESIIQDEYREASVFYAAAELLPQIGKIQLAEYYRGKFEMLAETARIETEQKYLKSVRAYPDTDADGANDRDKEGWRNSI